MQAQERLYELQDKLVEKELYSAKLYYDLGSYFGNCTNGGSNYEACIITAQNAIKDFPYSTKREQFAVLVMKSKFELAQRSVEEKRSTVSATPRTSATASSTSIPTHRTRNWPRNISRLQEIHQRTELGCSAFETTFTTKNSHIYQFKIWITKNQKHPSTQ